MDDAEDRKAELERIKDRILSVKPSDEYNIERIRPEQKAKAKPEPRPETKPKSKPKPETKPEPKPKPDTKHEPKPKPKPKPVKSSIPKKLESLHKLLASDVNKKVKAEPRQEPRQEPIHEPIQEPRQEPEPAPEHELDIAKTMTEIDAIEKEIAELTEKIDEMMAGAKRLESELEPEPKPEPEPEPVKSGAPEDQDDLHKLVDGKDVVESVQSAKDMFNAGTLYEPVPVAQRPKTVPNPEFIDIIDEMKARAKEGVSEPENEPEQEHEKEQEPEPEPDITKVEADIDTLEKEMTSLLAKIDRMIAGVKNPEPEPDITKAEADIAESMSQARLRHEVPIFIAPVDIPVLPEHQSDASKFVTAPKAEPDKSIHKDRRPRLDVKVKIVNMIRYLGRIKKRIMPDVRDPSDMEGYVAPNMFSDNDRFVGDDAMTVKTSGADAGKDIDRKLSPQPEQVIQPSRDMMSGRRNWQASQSGLAGGMMSHEDYKKVVDGIDDDDGKDEDGEENESDKKYEKGLKE
ncbi:hypothetical protein GQ472_01565 [archaeon]|nr:hypothetical protein [archaeon]